MVMIQKLSFGLLPINGLQKYSVADSFPAPTVKSKIPNLKVGADVNREEIKYAMASSFRAAKCFERAFFIYRDPRKVGN